MKLVQFNQICEDLWERYKADPYELFLTSPSLAELSADVFDYEMTHSVTCLIGGDGTCDVDLPAGVRVEEIRNPVTWRTMSVRLSEVPVDSIVTELYFSVAA